MSKKTQYLFIVLRFKVKKRSIERIIKHGVDVSCIQNNAHIENVTPKVVQVYLKTE